MGYYYMEVKVPDHDQLYLMLTSPLMWTSPLNSRLSQIQRYETCKAQDLGPRHETQDAKPHIQEL